MTVNGELLTGLGIALAIFLSSVGACYGSVYAGVFALRHASRGILSFAPVGIAGVLAIYGTIISMLLCGKLGSDHTLSAAEGYRYLASGLSVGLACFSSGLGIGKFLQEHVNGVFALPPSLRSLAERESMEDSGRPLLPIPGQQASLYTTTSMLPLLVVLVFLEAIGLYGLVVALILQKDSA
jgi:V-type H+-transporting ATPase proteolipid subunit